jgi:hypothetical protein
LEASAQIKNVRDTPVIVFGAGATKACGGPLTNEILREAFKAGPTLLPQQEAIQLLRTFLDENFPLVRANTEDYPSLSLLLSLLDTAIDRKQPFGLQWTADKVAEVRQAMEAAIFAVLDFQSPQSEMDSYLGPPPNGVSHRCAGSNRDFVETTT